MDSVRDLPCGRGCPIRRSRDQRSLASPPGFSQRATSFIASWRQGIHQMPLPQRLIAKPVARRDKTGKAVSRRNSQARTFKQRVSREDLFSRKPSALHLRPQPKAESSRFLGYSLFTLSKNNRLEPKAPKQSLLLPIPRPKDASASFVSDGVSSCPATAEAALRADLAGALLCTAPLSR